MTKREPCGAEWWWLAVRLQNFEFNCQVLVTELLQIDLLKVCAFGDLDQMESLLQFVPEAVNVVRGPVSVSHGAYWQLSTHLSHIAYSARSFCAAV